MGEQKIGEQMALSKSLESFRYSGNEVQSDLPRRLQVKFLSRVILESVPEILKSF